MAYSALSRQAYNNDYGLATYGDTYEQNLVLANKALLTSSAMTHVAVLSEMADTYAAISPGSARRCNFLADVYTAAAAEMIARR